MSDTPVRAISGLKPRSGGPDLSRLQRRNRNAAAEQAGPTSAEQDARSLAAPAPAGEGAREPDASEAIKQKPAATREQPATRSAPKPESERTGRLSTYLTMETLERARATYRATSHLEHDRTFSDFVERAIYAEILRREASHNSGERYDADTSRLRPGRPLG